MDAAHAALRRLRILFVVWFVVQSVVGTIVAAYVIEGLRHNDFLRHQMGGVSVNVTVSASILGSMLLLLVAWLVMVSLLELRPWARTVMLVVGWITLFGAVVSLVTLPESAALLGTFVGAEGEDWDMFQAVNVLTKTLDLAFWSWAIYTLQVNPVVRRAFLAGPDDTAGAGSEAPR